MQGGAGLGVAEYDGRANAVRSEESGGALIAVDAILPAGGGPPLLHRHLEYAAEVYRVERGELAIYLGDAAAAGQLRH